MSKKLYIAALLGLASAASAHAQLSSSVSVEGEYEPLVIETERLNSLPAAYRFELPASSLDYELTGVVTDFRPDLLTMGVTGRQTEWPWPRRRGFVDFRLGSWLNSRLHGGYFILDDDANSLLADIDFRSSALYRAGGVPETFTRLPRKRLYDGKIGLTYSRLTGTEGLLNAAASYRLGYFNYYGTTIDTETLPTGTAGIPVPTQTVNEARASVGFSSSPAPIDGWHAGASVDHLAYRRLYGRLGTSSEKGERETRLKADAGYAFRFAETSAIAIDAEGDFLFYPKRTADVIGISDNRPRNCGFVSLKPSYRMAGDAISLRAGADLNLSYDAMGTAPGKGFGLFHASPDVELQYHSKAGVGLLLEAKGGVTPSTLAMRGEFDRYQLPWILNTAPVFSPIDARLGVSAGPFAGFAAEVSARYVVARNTPLGGWYQAFLGSYPEYSAVSYLDPYLQTVNLHGFSIDLDLRYDFGTMVGLEFSGSYVPQKGTRGVFNGYDRPRWILDAKATVRPVSRLRIEIGYDYRGVRNCYRLTPGANGNDMTATRLPDITDLHAGVGYSVLDNLEIYCTGRNLLNTHPEILPGLQSEGIVICGGFSLEF